MREGKDGERAREGKGLKPPKVNFLLTSLINAMFGVMQCNKQSTAGFIDWPFTD
jgi:hypothetical protein